MVLSSGGDSSGPLIVKGADHGGDRPRRVLVVEDSKLIRRMYQDALPRYGSSRRPISVEFAESAADALAMLALGDRYDLILSDLYMPGVDGFELLQRIRAMPRYQDVPVLVVSTGDDEAQARAIGHGATSFLRKPVRFAELARTLNSLLNSQAPCESSSSTMTRP